MVSDTVVITRCTFTNNKALQFGGLIHVNSGSVSISGSTLTNNRAGEGGAINVDSGSLITLDSMLSNNHDGAITEQIGTMERLMLTQEVRSSQKSELKATEVHGVG